MIPRARSTKQGSSLPAAQADPLEQTLPGRSSSTTIDSPLVPANVKDALPGSRLIVEPVIRALGTVERMSRMKVSRASVSPAAVPVRDCCGGRGLAGQCGCHD